MSAVVIYDSRFGNTKKIAEAIGRGIGAGDVRVIHAAAGDSGIVDADLLVIGSPTHGGRYTPAIGRALAALAGEDLTRIGSAVFDTSMREEDYSGFVRFIIRLFGRSAPRLERALRRRGAAPVAVESFRVADREGPLLPGEIERAEAWGRELSGG